MDKYLRENNILKRILHFSIDYSVLWIFGFIYAIILIRAAESSSFSRVSAAIGLKAKLLCSTEMSGSIHVQWLDPSGTTLTYDTMVETGDSRFKIDHSYIKEWNLEIYNVRRSDAGNYTCSIGPTPIVNNFVELVVVVAPSLLRTSADVASVAGDPVTLSCEASGEPKPTISWTRLSSNNGSKLDLKFEGSQLNISAVTFEDAGTYECQANNNVPPAAFGRIRLEILFGPQITVLFREVSQEKGSSTLLSCLVRANPAEELFWVKNETIILHSNRYQVQNWGTGEYQTTLGLLITDLDDSDFGDYKCKAVNKYGQAEGKITINEYETGRVRVIATPEDSVARINDGVMFKCSAHSFDHSSYLIWWHILPNGDFQMIFISHLLKTAAGSSRYSFNETFQFDHVKYEIQGIYNLYIKRVNFNDSGTYVCDISGQQNFSAELTVVDRRVSCGSNRTAVSDGDSVTLFCSLAHHGPIANWHITWMHEEQPVTSTVEDSYDLIKRALRFNASYPHSSGTYQCIVTNSKLEYLSSCRVELSVLSSPTEGFVLPWNPCESCNGTTHCCSYISNAFIIVILASIVAVFFIISVVSVCCLVTHHKQEMAKFKDPHPKLKSTRNGNVDIELTPLTCSSPSPLPPA